MTNQYQQKCSTSGIDLLLEPVHTGARGLRTRVEEGLREAIGSGRLARGTRLPPTRTLARDLGVSRGTVLQAYAQLASEGWIAGHHGSGTVVALDASRHTPTTALREPPPVRWRFDLRPGRPDASSFPRAAWLRALRQALADAPDDALGYGGAKGQLALRAELASYLARARGLRVNAADLLITTGFTQGLGLICRALASAGVTRVAMEEPSMPLHREIVRSAGHQLVLIPVDGEGARVQDLQPTGQPGAVILTPNRQHPTGVVLSAPRRARLLDWARAAGAFVVEDDYDGEFRYDRHPLAPLQALDPAVVIYAGTASKTLAPGVRLGWLALPEPFRAQVTHEKVLADWQNSAVDQLAFAELLRTGTYDRHVRQMRLRYRRRRDALIHAVKQAHDGLRVTGEGAGLNLLVPLPNARIEAEAIGAANHAGIGLDGLATGGYNEHAQAAGLIIGYAAAPEHSYKRAIRALAHSLETLPREHVRGG
jgi:GntR family transcriptional regulator/MocR family aminotransferase